MRLKKKEGRIWNGMEFLVSSAPLRVLKMINGRRENGGMHLMNRWTTGKISEYV